MRGSAFRWLAVASAVIAAAVPAARAADGTPTYWNLAFDGEKANCRAIVSKADKLERYFETRHKTSCSTSDKGDYRVFECGQRRELIAFSREACLVRGDVEQTENQKRTLSAFNACMLPAKNSFALDDAVLYCTCMSRNVLRYTDDELAKMTRPENEQLGRQCLRDSGAVWAPPQPGKRERSEAAKPAPKPKPEADANAEPDHGTCFAVSREGLVVTALHVVEGSPNIAVRFVGGEWIPATLHAADSKNDVAILRVKARPRSWLSLVPAREAAADQHVFTVGFPAPRMQGEDAQLSEGAIRSGVQQETPLLQISTPIKPGNSGGPLVTEKGDVVGVVDFREDASDKKSHYAVKSDFALELLPQIPRQAAAQNRQVAIQRAVSAVCAVRAAN
jgi:S1-C subfamily serine protease